MSSRLSVLLLTVCLLLGLAACSKKPETADNRRCSNRRRPLPIIRRTHQRRRNLQRIHLLRCNRRRLRAAPAETAAPPPPKPKIVPAGTVIRVRLNDAIGSKTAQAGQTFTASVMDPIVVDGRTLIPAGATVAGEVTDAKSAGRFKGAAELAITIRSVTVGGVAHTLAASTVSQTSTGKGKRSAAMIGGGGGAGALIGGLGGRR